MTDDAISRIVEGVLGGNGHYPVEAEPLADVLTEVTAFMARFMAMTPCQLDAIALWAAHSHAVDELDVVAYLFVTSAEKRCGKTMLLDLLEHLCLRGRSTANISPAALYRMVDQVKPTLLFDEVDNVFATKRGAVDPAKSDLVGLINAGFRRGRPAYRMGGANMRTLEEFDPFGPKALAGIGGCLPDTLEDRCIPIRLSRKHRGESKARHRLRIHEPEAVALGQRLGAAVASAATNLRDVWPDLPDELSDRAQDIWEPLLMVADRAGGDWPARARAAAIELSAASTTTDDSNGVQLLADLGELFHAEETDRLWSAGVVEKLNALEERPWGGWHRGGGFQVRDLAKMLRAFGVASRDVRIGDVNRKGYLYDDLRDALDRYVAPPDATGATTATGLARHVADVAPVAVGVAESLFDGYVPPEEEP